MYKSATIRLTGCYLVVLMIISSFFSLAIYEITSKEVRTGLEGFKTNVQQIMLDDVNSHRQIIDLRKSEVENTNHNIMMKLIYSNLAILIIGGFLSYILARKTLIPIEKNHELQHRFTSDASHELRTPLANMKIEIETALETNPNNIKDLKQVLNSNLEEVDRLTELSNMLLMLSRLDNQKLEMSIIDLSRITSSVINEYFGHVKRFKLNIKQNLKVNANAIAIKDLIKILIDNAIEHSPKDTVIKISLIRDHGQAQFKITNKGIGIDQKDLPHIFDRFYRIDKSRNRKSNSHFGLGLSIAKSITDQHNSKITVTSIKNKQTSFEFKIPISDNGILS